MKIDYEFTVGVPVDQAWGRMLDLEKIAPCLPGAAIQEETADGEYAGTITVEIGPITVGYKGTVMFEETDERSHRAVLRATGRETRGQGTASATIVSTLREEGDGTRVNVETDLLLTGRVAQFGRGIAQGVATEMLDEFAACLEREISGAAEPAALTSDGISDDEDPAVPAGGTVEGAIVAGSSPSEAAAGAPTTPTQQPAIQALSRREPPRRTDSFDLDAAVRDAMPQRLTLALTGVGALLALLWLLRKRR